MGHGTEPQLFEPRLVYDFERERRDTLPLAFAWLEIHDLLPPKRFLPEIAPHMHSGVLDRRGYHELQGGVCPLCMERMPKKMRPPRVAKPIDSLPPKVSRKVIATMRRMVTRDHIEPRVNKGLDVVFNVVATHGACNSAKGEVSLIMFMWAKATGRVNFVRQAYSRQHARRHAEIRESRQMTIQARMKFFTNL